ncbi:MAG: hypothetical protein U1A78_07695 [Polyangia bacterium]
MAKRYDQGELWELIRYAVGHDHPTLREAPMSFLVEDVPGQGATVLGLVVAEPDESLCMLTEAAHEKA